MRRSHIVLFVAALLGVAAAVHAQEWQLRFVSSGAAVKAGSFSPQSLKLAAEKPDGARKLPADLTAPIYSILKLGPSDRASSFVVLLDEPEGRDPRLFVDGNANGDLTDDPPLEWKASAYKDQAGHDRKLYSGAAAVQLWASGVDLAPHVNFYRFDRADAERAALKDQVFYYGVIH